MEIAIISAIITEAHPHYAYGSDSMSTLTIAEGDIITTCLEDPAPDREIFVVNGVISKTIFSVNKPIPDPVGKRLRKLTTVKELKAKVQAAAGIDPHEQEIRDKMHELFLNEEFSGTIEERLMDGYLYTLSSEDLSLSDEERIRIRGPYKREVMVQTGKAGVLSYIAAGKKQGQSEAMIAKGIWIDMIVQDVRMFVNIKNIKINAKDDLQEQIEKIRERNIPEVAEMLIADLKKTKTNEKDTSKEDDRDAQEKLPE